MFEKLKTIFAKDTVKDTVTEPLETVKKQRKVKPKIQQEEVSLSEKERATAAGEPYVAILKVDINPENINAGSFELDWNDKFVLNLIRAGYKRREDDTEQDIVDRWFQTVCRNIALEVYEQQAADPKNRETDLRQVSRRDLGNGRSEIS